MRTLPDVRAAFALLVASCAAVVEVPSLPARCGAWDPAGLNTEQTAVLDDAAARWSAVTREPVRIDPGGCAVHVVDELGDGGIVGEYEPGAMVVRRDAFVRSVVMHEMGHGLGLEHVDGGVMNAVPWGTMTAADVAECRRVGACATNDETPATP